MPLFCRHNRFEHSCHICGQKASPQADKVTAPRSAARTRATGATRRSPGVVTKRMARSADDGYRHQLVPGLKSSADAERLAAALATAQQRLRRPGPHPIVAAETDVDTASRMAFLLALAGDEHPSLQSGVLGEGEVVLEGDAPRAIAAYDAWITKAGSAQQAFAGDASWSASRRFQRAFDRLAFPGFARKARYELLTTLGGAGTFELEGDSLHIGAGGSDSTILAAKRILNSGDTMLLERRASQLADATGVSIGALDHGFSVWELAWEIDEPPPEQLQRIRHALRLDVDAEA